MHWTREKGFLFKILYIRRNSFARIANKLHGLISQAGLQVSASGLNLEVVEVHLSCQTGSQPSKELP